MSTNIQLLLYKKKLEERLYNLRQARIDREVLAGEAKKDRDEHRAQAHKSSLILFWTLVVLTIATITDIAFKIFKDGISNWFWILPVVLIVLGILIFPKKSGGK